MSFNNDFKIEVAAVSDDGNQTKKSKNQSILLITCILFGIFVIAEIIGAFASGSLALLGDAAAMSVDVFTVSLIDFTFANI